MMHGTMNVKIMLLLSVFMNINNTVHLIIEPANTYENLSLCI
jgi:hypothetical protein